MQTEYNYFMRNKIQELIPRPLDQHLLGVNGFIDLKPYVSSNIDKRNSRMVAQGYLQIHGLDYTETFSPIVKPPPYM